jgi:hypothetical protein
LQTLLHKGRIHVDLQGEIVSEYHAHLRPSGQPGVGDRFYREILNSSIKKIVRVDSPRDATTNTHTHFPNHSLLANFDKGDSMFVAVANVSGSTIAVAIDRGWLNHEGALGQQGINLDFLCGKVRAQMLK